MEERTLATLDLIIPLAAVLALGSAARADESSFSVDAGASTLTVRAYRDGVLSTLGHDHTIEARGVTGTVDVDPARPEAGRVAFDVPSARLEVIDPGVSESDRASVQANMERDVLDVASYPTISFRSTVVRRSARVATSTAVELDVTGDLTLHGTTRRVTVPVTLTIAGGSLAAAGAVSIDQPDFGIEPYSAFLGAVKVRKDVRIEFSIKAHSGGAR
jgi:polyisoprenoid-binding protein YceI